MCCRYLTESADLRGIHSRLQARADRVKDVSYGVELIAVGGCGGSDMGSAVDVDPKVFVAPLGFENGNFSSLEGAADRRTKQIRAKDQVIGTAKQHGTAR